MRPYSFPSYNAPNPHEQESYDYKEPWEYSFREWLDLNGDLKEHRESVLKAYEEDLPVDADTIEIYRDGGWIQ